MIVNFLVGIVSFPKLVPVDLLTSFEVLTSFILLRTFSWVLECVGLCLSVPTVFLHIKNVFLWIVVEFLNWNCPAVLGLICLPRELLRIYPILWFSPRVLCLLICQLFDTIPSLYWSVLDVSPSVFCLEPAFWVTDILSWSSSLLRTWIPGLFLYQYSSENRLGFISYLSFFLLPINNLLLLCKSDTIWL